jgi:hypothetical protein
VKILGLLLLLLLPTFAFGGIPKEITYEEAGEMGVSAQTWKYTKNESDREKLRKHYLCTPITLYAPLVDLEHPDFTKLKVVATILKEGKILTYSALDVSKKVRDKRHTASGCLPLSKEYEVNIVLSYNPKESILMCPPAFKITNFGGFIESGYNKNFEVNTENKTRLK